MTDPVKLGEYTWAIDNLARDYPADWRHPNKKFVASVAGDDTATKGSITVSRWRAPELPEKALLKNSKVFLQKGFFAYPESSADATSSASAQHWHMNFADPCVFAFGEGPLLAQDELQIVEHPILCSLGKAIGSGTHGVPTLTRSTRNESNVATPLLVQGAPRRCKLHTTGAYGAIYGNHFAQASEKTIREATEPLRPPRLSNIVAIAAVEPHLGLYSTSQIRTLLQTAYAGFRATVLVSMPYHSVTLHTGHWGCGAFGGNKGLVAATQILAAGMAGVKELHYWYGSGTQDLTAVQHGLAVSELLNGMDVNDVVELLESAGYSWGVANENHVEYEPPANCLVLRAQREE